MNNIFKLLVAGVSLAVLSGCANTQAVSGEESYYSNGKVDYNHKLYKNVSVEKVDDFLETSKNLFSDKKTSNLNNEEARIALEKSLKASGMLSNGYADYSLDATLVDADLASLMSDRMEERNVSIEYNLKYSGNNIYSNVITGNGENEVGFIYLQWKEEHNTSKKAYKDNFRQLIEDLKDL